MGWDRQSSRARIVDRSSLWRRSGATRKLPCASSPTPSSREGESGVPKLPPRPGPGGFDEYRRASSARGRRRRGENIVGWLVVGGGGRSVGPAAADLGPPPRRLTRICIELRGGSRAPVDSVREERRRRSGRCLNMRANTGCGGWRWRLLSMGLSLYI